MILVAAAFACDPIAAVATLRTTGDRDAYLCVSGAEVARDPLVAAIVAEPDNTRLTRALALWIIERAEQPFDADLVRRLNPADRRLLADAVRARRGRKTPVADHAKVFEQFAWYQPRETYTDSRLTAQDRANIGLADDPPPPKPPTELPPAPDHGCNCNRAAFVLPLAFFRRRR